MIVIRVCYMMDMSSYQLVLAKFVIGSTAMPVDSAAGSFSDEPCCALKESALIGGVARSPLADSYNSMVDPGSEKRAAPQRARTVWVVRIRMRKLDDDGIVVNKVKLR